MENKTDDLELRPELTMAEFEERIAAFGSAATIDATLFSDLDRAKLAVVRRAWPKWPLETRRKLVATMNELGEQNIEYHFGRALKLGLRDDDATVRTDAITGLWEDESEDVLSFLVNEGVRDPNLGVREATMRALARFSQLVAEEEIDLRWFTPLRATLLEFVRGNDSIEVRRRALEALSVYTEDPAVTAEIERAYHSDSEVLRMSALYAMGRNLDGRWLNTIIAEMDSASPGMRYEATKASGEFGDRRAIPQLIERLGDDDREVQLTAVGAIGRIGGSASVNILKRLASSEDDVVREAAEEAIDEASFMTNPISVGGRFDRGGQ